MLKFDFLMFLAVSSVDLVVTNIKYLFWFVFSTDQNNFFLDLFLFFDYQIGWWAPEDIRLLQYNIISKKLSNNLDNSTEIALKCVSLVLKTTIKCGLKRERGEKKTKAFISAQWKNMTIAIIKIWRCT